MDISSLTSGRTMRAEMEYNDEVKVVINHIPRERIAQLLKQATKTFFNRQHQKEEEVDNIKFGELLGSEAIESWSGLEADGKPFPCTEENKRFLMRTWADFARFVSDSCTDLDKLVEAQKEAERKNLSSTSGQESITQE